MQNGQRVLYRYRTTCFCLLAATLLIGLRLFAAQAISQQPTNYRVPTRGGTPTDGQRQPPTRTPLPTPAASAPLTVDVELPSTSTGVSGGTLAVRLFAPSNAASARHPEGAPIVIFAPGGDAPGALDAPLPRASDVLRVAFLFPGGLNNGRRSSGEYDFRGERSIAALRDVILYAAGLLNDKDGRRIDEVVPVRLQHHNIGLFGSSNGGNIIIAVAALHGTEFNQFVRYFIQWESPTCSQVAVGDVAPVRLVCAGGQNHNLPAANPWYNAGGNTLSELAVDYSRVRFNPANQAQPLFLDGNGDGRYTLVNDPARAGCQTPDLNGDGNLSGEDYPLAAYRAAGNRLAYSRQATQAFARYNVFATGQWPANILTVAEANAFWDVREAAQLYERALNAMPQLEGMFLASLIDHVQTTLTEKAHAQLTFHNLHVRGRWNKLNPARGYLTALDPRLGNRTDLPDNQANVAPNWNDPASYAYPEDVDITAQSAAVHEMADRARQRILPPTPTPTPVATPTPTPTPVATPTPTPQPTATPTPNGSHGLSPNWQAEVQVSNTGAYSGGTVGRGLAAGANNRLHTVWTEQANNQFDIFYARSTDGGRTWSAGRDLNQNNFPANGANIAAGPNDAVHVAWVDRRNGTPSRIYYTRSTNGGDSFETPRDISGATSADVSAPSLSVDDRNRVHVAWHSGNPDQASPVAQVFYTRSTNGGAAFETARKLNTGSGHAAFPRFSVEKTNGDLLAIAWRDNRRNPDWDVYVAVSADGGASFTERVGVATQARDWDPDVMVDRNGIIHLGVMTYRPQPTGVTVDYLRSTDQGRTWNASVTLSEALSRFPFWAPDNARGVLWLFWKDERDAATNNGEEERNADIACKYSTDGGRTWSALEFATDKGALEVKFPSPIVGSDGRPHVIWSDQRFGATRETIFLASRRNAPSVTATPTPTPSPTATPTPTPTPMPSTGSLVYISGTMHIESNRLRWPRVDDLLAFFARATQVGKTGNQPTGMKWSVGADIGWLTGEPRAAEVIARLEAMGVELDIHAHEFADRANCAARITQLGGHPNKVSSGNVVTEIDRLRLPVVGNNDATWQAEILYGTALRPDHSPGSEDFGYGVWRPKSGAEFKVHDPNGNLISVGGGPRTLTGAQALIDYLKTATGLPPVFSTTVMVHPDALVVVGTTNGIAQIEAWAAVAGANAQVRWATLSQTAAAWKAAGGVSSRLESLR